MSKNQYDMGGLIGSVLFAQYLKWGIDDLCKAIASGKAKIEVKIVPPASGVAGARVRARARVNNGGHKT
jgi:hypothetical protein